MKIIKWIKHETRPLISAAGFLSATGVTLAIIDTFIKPISLTALALLGVATIPWLRSLIKEIEFPGGVKIKLSELEQVKKELEASGLISQNAVGSKEEYSFLEVSKNDPKLALAGLRIELENTLRRIAESKGMKVQRASVRTLMEMLSREQVLSASEVSAISDLIPMLNKAVHGEDVPPGTLGWAMEVAPDLLDSLRRRI